MPGSACFDQSASSANSAFAGAPRPAWNCTVQGPLIASAVGCTRFSMTPRATRCHRPRCSRPGSRLAIFICPPSLPELRQPRRRLPPCTEENHALARHLDNLVCRTRRFPKDHEHRTRRVKVERQLGAQRCVPEYRQACESHPSPDPTAPAASPSPGTCTGPPPPDAADWPRNRSRSGLRADESNSGPRWASPPALRRPRRKPRPCVTDMIASSVTGGSTTKPKSAPPASSSSTSTHRPAPNHATGAQLVFGDVGARRPRPTFPAPGPAPPRRSADNSAGSASAPAWGLATTAPAWTRSRSLRTTSGVRVSPFGNCKRR